MSVIAAPTQPRRGRPPRPWTDAELARMQALGVFAGRSLTLAGGTIVEQLPGQPARPVAFTRTEFYALEDAGFFRGQRARLIRGAVVLEPPMNPPHAAVVMLVLHILQGICPTGHHVRSQLPLDLGLDTEPQPDVSVVSGSPREYLAEHPKTAVLVVEVGDTTLYEDLTDMAELYAIAGIADYWVIDVPGRQLHVLRDPAPVAAGGAAYRSQQTLGPTESVAPLAAPNSPVTVAELLP